MKSSGNPLSIVSRGNPSRRSFKVVHVTPVYSPLIGGIGTVVRGLATVTATKANAKVNVAFCDVDWDARAKCSWKDGLVEVAHIKAKKIWFVYFPIDLRPHLQDADIIHLHDPFFSPLCVATVLFANYRSIIVMSTHGGFFHTPRWRLLKKMYFNTISRLITLRFAMTVAVSAQDHELFSRISGRVTLIENGVDIGKFCKLDIIPKDNRFIFIGRFSLNKNIEQLVRVFIELAKLDGDVTLDLIGDDPYRVWDNRLNKMIIQAKLSNSIFYHGSLEDHQIVALMGDAKFFLLASTYEGFGIAVVEAMSAGRIPIVNDIPPMRKLIENGQNGFIINFDDVPSAAKAIKEIMDYPSASLQRIGEAARISSERFSWEKVGERYLDLYEKCLSN